MIIELTLLFLLIVAIIAGYFILRTAGRLIINTILGLILLVVSNFVFNLGIAYSIPVILICALGGIPGAILVILLHVLGIAF
ncbi:pro-sigmaK processing inhibitor BofA family protein [Candidatus Methanoperedens nitratireducens]|uniref:SigmaK-factor processing regulatory protein BofA n=1 Tax=Candidatus Methanoperedens nitratireducens TaxID=1392998 RepID=A0A284VTU3_9EURY|nr:pro-sigmaK processing inhibitor BofA family protein [Candidatus Methanoperedens nitroreducens]SNQ62629.1 conserved membrane hypothetical protein [Candidatus Methanoperedens nitroreducens]